MFRCKCPSKIKGEGVGPAWETSRLTPPNLQTLAPRRKALVKHFAKELRTCYLSIKLEETTCKIYFNFGKEKKKDKKKSQAVWLDTLNT